MQHTDYEEQIGPIVHIIVYMFSLMGFFALNYKQTRWVLTRFNKVLRRFSTREVNQIAFGSGAFQSSNDPAMNGYQELNSEFTRTETKRRHIKLEHIFGHDRAFDIFMNYLYKQHCAEVLLSLTEMTQFQQLIYEDLWTTLAINELNGQGLDNNEKNKDFKLFGNSMNSSTPSPMYGPKPSTTRTHKKSLSLSLRSLGPYNNHNRSGGYKPFEIQISGNGNLESNRSPNLHPIHASSTSNSSSKTSLEMTSWNNILNGKYGNSTNNSTLTEITEEDRSSRSSSLNIADQQIKSMGDTLVNLPPTIPRSSIVYCRFETEDRKTSFEEDNRNTGKNLIGKLKKYRLIAFDIYDKYIRIGSEYEINIDYGNRKRYNRILANKRLWINKGNGINSIDENSKNNNVIYNAQYLQEAMILFSLYQPCIDQMYRFCSSCFGTFKATQEFDHLTDLFKIKNLNGDNEL